MEEKITFVERANRQYSARAILLTEAKIYITENCHKVTDWSQMFLEIKNGNNTDNSNKLKEFFYVPYEPAFHNKWHMHSVVLGNETSTYEYKDESVKTVTDPVYDDFDGDFSITINGLEWWWINYNAVIALSVFIEKTLNPELYIAYLG